MDLYLGSFLTPESLMVCCIQVLSAPYIHQVLNTPCMLHHSLCTGSPSCEHVAYVGAGANDLLKHVKLPVKPVSPRQQLDWQAQQQLKKQTFRAVSSAEPKFHSTGYDYSGKSPTLLLDGQAQYGDVPTHPLVNLVIIENDLAQHPQISWMDCAFLSCFQ